MKLFTTATDLVFFLLIFFVPILPDEKIIRLKLVGLEIFVLLLVFLWLNKMLFAGRISLKKNMLNLSIFIYSVYIFFLYLVSKNKPVAISELNRMLLCLSIYLVALNNLNTENVLQRIFLVWLLSALLVSLYGIGQYYGGINLGKIRLQIPQMQRIMSTFGNPIFYAAFLVITIPLGLGFFIQTNSLRGRIFLLFALCSMFYALYLTATRAAWIGLTVAIAFFISLILKTKRQKIIFLILFTLCFMLFAYLTRPVWLRKQEHPLIWRDTINMFTKNPFGVGLGVYHLYFPKYISDGLKSIFPQTRFIINDAHNEYLQILAETGILGFILFFWIIFSFYRYGIKVSGNKKFFSVSILSSGTAILIQNFFSVDMRFIISAVYFFLLLGMLSSVEQRKTELPLNLPTTGKVFLFFVLCLGGYYTSMQIAKPYLAQKRLAEKLDFFDEKVEDPQGTIKELEKLIQVHPDEVKLYEKLAWVYAKEKNFTKAIENYEKALSLNPNLPGIYNNLGNIYFLLGRRLEAIENYQNSLMLNPKQIDARLNLGTAYFYQGMLKESADEFRHVLELDPKNEKAIVMLKRMTE